MTTDPTPSPDVREIAAEIDAQRPAEGGPDGRPASMLRRVDDLFCECRADGQCEHNGLAALDGGLPAAPAPTRSGEEER